MTEESSYLELMSSSLKRDFKRCSLAFDNEFSAYYFYFTHDTLAEKCGATQEKLGGPGRPCTTFLIASIITNAILNAKDVMPRLTSVPHRGDVNRALDGSLL